MTPGAALAAWRPSERQPARSDAQRGPLGATLKRLREETPGRMSQSRLAERSGLSHSYICRIESGDRMPSREALTFMADALHLSDGDRSVLFAAAGFIDGKVPITDPVVISLAVLLADDDVPDHIRQSIRQQVSGITTLAGAWRKAAA